MLRRPSQLSLHAVLLAVALAPRAMLPAAAFALTPPATAADRADIHYPDVATVTPHQVLGEFGGVRVYGGGYGSALAVDPQAPGYFYLMTDRGPNADGSDAGQKVFPIPRYTPQIGRFRLEGDQLVQVATIPLRNAEGRALTGLPNPGPGSTGEAAVDMQGRALGTDPDGIDSEGLVALRDGTFWISDEYGPWLVHVDAQGRTLQRIGPYGGERSLPRVLALRPPNRGMEGLAATPDGTTLVGMMQSPLNNPEKGAARGSRLVRIVFFDTRTGKSRQYGYLLDSTHTVVSDIAAVTATSFIVCERDSHFPGDPKSPSTVKRIYRIDVSRATDLSDPEDRPNGRLVDGKTLEQASASALERAGIVTVGKTLAVDLLALPGGYPHDKPEGLAVINPTLIAVANDDDFGIDSDGHGGIAPKRLPAEHGRIDVDRVYFIKLARPLE